MNAKWRYPNKTTLLPTKITLSCFSIHAKFVTITTIFPEANKPRIHGGKIALISLYYILLTRWTTNWRQDLATYFPSADQQVSKQYNDLRCCPLRLSHLLGRMSDKERNPWTKHSLVSWINKINKWGRWKMRQDEAFLSKLHVHAWKHQMKYIGNLH
jgi:hypothetical protein